MREFLISPKVAKQLLIWTAFVIVVLTVTCVLFDKEDEEAPQAVNLDCQSVTEIISEIQTANTLLKKQSIEVGEINNSTTGIFGIAKGIMEVSPSLKPEINIQPGKPRRPRKPQKDTLEVVATINANDSIVITINNEDSIVSIPPNETSPKSPTGKKCCCCNCCCTECKEEGCR